jgi:hypothetical protein
MVARTGDLSAVAGGVSHGGLALLRHLADKTADQRLSAWPPERRVSQKWEPTCSAATGPSATGSDSSCRSRAPGSTQSTVTDTLKFPDTVGTG